MKRGHVRWWVAIVLLAILTVVFVLMGRWQLERAEERRAVAAEIQRGRDAAAVTVTATHASQSLQPWQAVTAQGRWLPQYSVLLDNRAQEGRPGLWLAMPFELSDGAVVLVLRGWLPRPLGQEPVALKMIQPTDTVEIYGEIATHVPRLYELAADGPVQFMPLRTDHEDGAWSLDLKSAPWRQNVTLEEMRTALQRPLLPFVVMQTGVDGSISLAGQPLVRQWPAPSIDSDKNMGYAMQWFMFAAIALAACVILLWRQLRRATITT